jgi:hypothetical protein
MPTMTTRPWRLRLAGLLAGGAFALHQLRYLLGYGDHSHGALAGQGHAYMTLLAPLVAVALIVSVADFWARLVDARARRRAAAAPGLLPLWGAASACLVAAYGVQETLEGALVPGHPAGLAGVLGHGGWAALPLAAAIALVIALVVRGAQRTIELAAEPPLSVARPRALVSLGSALVRRSAGGRPVARRPAARAPPLAAIP